MLQISFPAGQSASQITEVTAETPGYRGWGSAVSLLDTSVKAIFKYCFSSMAIGHSSVGAVQWGWYHCFSVGEIALQVNSPMSTPLG